MVEFIGNCNNIINWDRVIADCQHSGPHHEGPDFGWEAELPQLVEIKGLWEKWYKPAADGGTVAWESFFPGKQWRQRDADAFCDFVGLTEPVSVWISRIMPGCFAPVHWDVQSDENTYIPEEEYLFKRFHCHITNPNPGHFFVVDETAFYNEDKGNVYKWQSRKSWHAGSNCGLAPKYLLNAFGK